MTKKAAQVNGPRLDSIERSDHEEAITSWMDAHEFLEDGDLHPPLLLRVSTSRRSNPCSQAI
jgi:hypothetical protein